MLEQHGLVRHVHLGHGPGLYMLSGRAAAEYLYCSACGRVTAVTPEELDAVRAEVRERFGYRVSFTHFAIVGECADCADRVAGASRDVRTDAHSHGDYVHAHSHGRGGHTHRG